jgi:two-component system OmpR family sensor kinase/two-component system sensor histidine kinase QseC
MSSIRARLLAVLLILVAGASALAGVLTYRRVLAETSTLFDYQLRQMALSLRSQVLLAPRLELPPQQGDADFVIQIWDPFGARIYLSRPGLPLINRVALGYADLDLNGDTWRAYGLQTADGVIQIAQPARVRQVLARRAALHVLIPLLALLPLLAGAVAWSVRAALGPLSRIAAEVRRRDANALAPIETAPLPQEVAPLVDALNRMLQRLQGAFQTQRAFVADAAHELRSPLTALNLQLQLLDRAPDEAAVQEARAALRSAVERARHMVDQLLTLARNEPGAAGAALAPIELESATADGIGDTHALAQARGVELGLEAEPGISIRGEREALRALVRNLVDNAVRHAPRGGRVSVRLRSRPAAVQLEVIDNGPGIPAADRARAFDRFYRRSGAPQGGSGLGLSIVRAIAERHGAAVDLADAPGGGLQVTVEFPRSPG